MTIQRLLMVAACVSCLGCRTSGPSNPEGAAPSAGDPPGARVQTQSVGGSAVVYAYYFHRTFRCISCLSMEEMAADAIEEHFAQQQQNGQVVWMPVNIEDSATETLRKQLDVQGTGLVLARMENGVYKNSKSLDKLWGLLSRPEDFSKCVVDEVSVCLSGTQER